MTTTATRPVPRCAIDSPANEGQTRATLNLKAQMYLNCGCWQNGRSDFALVSGGEIVLCTWGNFNGELTEPYGGVRLEFLPELKKEASEPMAFESDKIRRFFADAPEGRAHPLVHYQAPCGIRFTEPGELLVFGGDCHVHLYKEWICDNFVKRMKGSEVIKNVPPYRVHVGEQQAGKNGYLTKRQTMAQDFYAFIQHALKHAGRKENVIQVGDLYEVWEVQAVFDLAYDVICDVLKGFTGRELELIKGLNDEQIRKDDRRTGHGTASLPAVSDGLRRRAYLVRPFPTSLLADEKRYLQILDAEKTRLGDRMPRNPAWAVLPKYFGIDASNSAAERWQAAVAPKDALALVYWRHGMQIREEASPTGKLLYAPISDTGRWYAPLEGFPGLQHGHEPLEFLKRDHVIEAIKSAYEPEIPREFWDSFTHIHGNHDTTYPNYLHRCTYDGPDGRKHWQKRVEKEWIDADDPEATLIDDQLSHVVGPKKQICYEHGHAFDPYNNDLNYYRYAVGVHRSGHFGTGVSDALDGVDGEHRSRALRFNTDAGYVKTVRWIEGELLNPTGWLQNTKGELGQEELVKYADHRMEKIFERNRRISLVVMGHTHVALLKDRAARVREEEEASKRRREWLERQNAMRQPKY